MKKDKNSLWAFFASVKLALFVFFILAVTSIIGTIIPQGKPPEFYIQNFGQGTAKLFDLLNVPDMYNSWWFVALLGLFSVNLIVCTIDRFPNIWRLVKVDNLALDPERVAKMPQRLTFYSGDTVENVREKIKGIMSSAGWNAESSDKAEGTLYSSQKGAWTRLGVIFVHTSILIIFIGAIIGSVFGFKGSVMIPEGRSADRIFAFDSNGSEIPLDFSVRLNRFDLHYYDTGMPKDYQSDLTVIQDGKPVLHKQIEVNDPLEYGGLTFYQSSYNKYDNTYVVDIVNQTTSEKKSFVIAPRREAQWPAEGLTFGIINRMGPDYMGGFRHKIWFTDNKADPSQFWMDESETKKIIRPDTTYEFTLRQYFATGLQVTKDPGVWYVYAGCALMLLGLYVAFFLSHRRVWVYVTRDESRTKVLVSGTSSRNKVGFEKDFENLTEHFENSESLNLTTS